MVTNLPQQMRSTGHDAFELPSGRNVEVPKCHLMLPVWRGEEVPTYGGKTILDYDGQPLYAELVVVKMFQDAGWNAVWVDTYRRTYRVGLPETDKSTVSRSEIDTSPPFITFPAAFEKFSGCWDVVAWKGNEIVFCECKRQKKDAIRDTQLMWLEGRLSEGASVDQFLIVEWEPQPVEPPQTVSLEQGRWYALQLLPGYINGPYFSVIQVTKSVQLIPSEEPICIEYWDPGYAQGVQSFERQVRTLKCARDLVVFEEVGQDPTANRVLVVSALNQGWASVALAAFNTNENPMFESEIHDNDYQGYLDRVFAQASKV